jgi:hypothetical protein
MLENRVDYETDQLFFRARRLNQGEKLSIEGKLLLKIGFRKGGHAANLDQGTRFPKQARVVLFDSMYPKKAYLAAFCTAPRWVRNAKKGERDKMVRSGGF